MVQREKDKCGRGVLSKPDRARSPFPLQQFLEMMSLFIKKKIEKEKCVCAAGSTRAKVRGEGGSGGREARERER